MSMMDPMGGGQPDQRGLLARLIAMLRGQGGASGAFPPPPGQNMPMPGAAFPEAPAGDPTDMSMAGPWGAGFPPAPPDPVVQPVPTPTPRPAGPRDDNSRPSFSGLTEIARRR